jgi:tetratricopeptide (TPR) repeat protein
MGIVHSEMEHKTEALSELGKALSLAIESQDLPRKLRILDLLGDIFYALESFDKAAEDYVIAYETAKILGNRPAGCTALVKVANVFLSEGEYVAAIGQYERALEIASSLENRNAEISILGGLLRANALSGSIALALKYGDQVVHLAREFNHFDAEITNIYTLASFLIDQGRADEASLYLDRGRLLAQENQSQHWLQAIITLIGTVHYNDGNYEDAFNNYKEALAQAMSEADVENEARLCGYLGAVLADRELYIESIEYATRADNLANELENYALAGEQQMLLAFNYRDTNQPEKAKEYCKAAINSYEAVGNLELAEKAGLLLSELQG